MTPLPRNPDATISSLDKAVWPTAIGQLHYARIHNNNFNSL